MIVWWRHKAPGLYPCTRRMLAVANYNPLSLLLYSTSQLSRLLLHMWLTCTQSLIADYCKSTSTSSSSKIFSPQPATTHCISQTWICRQARTMYLKRRSFYFHRGVCDFHTGTSDVQLPVQMRDIANWTYSSQHLLDPSGLEDTISIVLFLSCCIILCVIPLVQCS